MKGHEHATTRIGSFTHEEEVALRREDDALLMERMNRVNAKSRELAEQSDQARRTSAAHIAKLRDLTTISDAASAPAQKPKSAAP